MSSLTIEDIDSVSEIDRDTLAPLPAWNQNHYNPYGPTYVPPPPAPMPNYAPLPNKPCYQQQAGMPMPGQPPQPGGQPGMPGYANDNASYVSMPGANGSVLSYQSGSGMSVIRLFIVCWFFFVRFLPFLKIQFIV